MSATTDGKPTRKPGFKSVGTDTTPSHTCGLIGGDRLDQTGVILLDVADNRSWPARLTFCSAGYDARNVLSCSGLVCLAGLTFATRWIVRCRAVSVPAGSFQSVCDLVMKWDEPA